MLPIKPDDFAPKTLDDMVGQTHLIGPQKFLTTLVTTNTLTSLVLTGPPGIGKTSLLKVLGRLFNRHILWFHASIDAKQKLVDAIATVKLEPSAYLLVIEEIHRLHRDKQDVLLHYLEDASHLLCATTTSNPYYVLNQALLSRVNVVQMKPLRTAVIVVKLEQWYDQLVQPKQIEPAEREAFRQLVRYSNADLRKTLDWFCLLINSQQAITVQNVDQFCAGLTDHLLASEKVSVHDLKSALQKSIRGSDVHAALLYSAGLLQQGELEALLRRLVVIAYEDVGLAHPNLCQRVISAVQECRLIGLPECRIIIANLVVELSLAIKSNSAYVAMDRAIALWAQSPLIQVPVYLKANGPAKSTYRYPHDYPRHWVQQQYWPLNLAKQQLYQAQTNSYFEQSMNEKHDQVVKPSS